MPCRGRHHHRAPVHVAYPGFRRRLRIRHRLRLRPDFCAHHDQHGAGRHGCLHRRWLCHERQQRGRPDPHRHRHRLPGVEDRLREGLGGRQRVPRVRHHHDGDPVRHAACDAPPRGPPGARGRVPGEAGGPAEHRRQGQRHRRHHRQRHDARRLRQQRHPDHHRRLRRLVLEARRRRHDHRHRVCGFRQRRAAAPRRPQPQRQRLRRHVRVHHADRLHRAGHHVRRARRPRHRPRQGRRPHGALVPRGPVPHVRRHLPRRQRLQRPGLGHRRQLRHARRGGARRPVLPLQRRDGPRQHPDEAAERQGLQPQLPHVQLRGRRLRHPPRDWWPRRPRLDVPRRPERLRRDDQARHHCAVERQDLVGQRRSAHHRHRHWLRQQLDRGVERRYVRCRFVDHDPARVRDHRHRGVHGPRARRVD
mmetsp:Transcript_21360/g.66246  ORF Transcript_21360/g.66246 Transcript_21360/m.66246 type:complete len:419 (+) Transcript_21360:287-1543(+)